MAHSTHFEGCRPVSGEPCNCEIKRYAYILLITLGIAVIQLIGSYYSGSLALLVDTLHVLLDGASAGISIYVAYRVRTHHDPVGLRIRWMRVSGVLLLMALVWVAFEAIHRFNHPQPVVAWIVIFTAFTGGYLNYRQHQMLPHDHTPTSWMQRFHILGDLGVSVAVLFGGIAMYYTRALWIDPVLSFGVAVVIGALTLKMLFSKQAPTSREHTH